MGAPGGIPFFLSTTIPGAVNRRRESSRLHIGVCCWPIVSRAASALPTSAPVAFGASYCPDRLGIVMVVC
jgi:hypothetical protein